jgi:hypothetical protein
VAFAKDSFCDDGEVQRLIGKFHYDLMAGITAANIFAVPLTDMPRG